MRFSLQILILYALLNDIGIVNAKAKNELGIGIGSIYYSKQYQPKEWQYTIAFQKSHEVTTDDVKVLTLPAIYYTRFLNRRLQFRIQYQYSAERRTMSNFGGGDAIYTDSRTKHLISLGYYYSFWNPKKIQVSIGLGFEGDPTYHKVKNSSSGQSIYEYTAFDGLLMPSLRMGITVPLYKNLNLKYDVACATDFSHLYFSPLNRLSVNLGF